MMRGGKYVAHFAPDHCGDDLIPCQINCVVCADRFAVSEDGYAVAHPKDLFQLMRNIDHTDAA